MKKKRPFNAFSVTVPDEHLLVVEVYGRCRFMWDTKGFEAEASNRHKSTRTLYEQITGYIEDDKFYAEAAYVGYSMYLGGPVFANEVRKNADDSELRNFSFQGNRFRVEPGAITVGSGFVPHSGATTRTNLLALKLWDNHTFAEESC